MNIRAMRRRLSEAQNHRCCYCGRAMNLDSDYNGDDIAATIEHVIALSRGGSDAWDNLAAACHRCNSKRQHMDAYEFFERRLYLSPRMPAVPKPKTVYTWIATDKNGNVVGKFVGSHAPASRVQFGDIPPDASFWLVGKGDRRV